MTKYDVWTVTAGRGERRLDRSKPPPGIWIDGEVWGEERIDYDETATAEKDEASALAAAWAYHEARNDPPGMQVIGDDAHGWFCEVIDPPDGGSVGPGARPDEWRGPDLCEAETTARAAAWRWYWRRVDAWNRTAATVRGSLGVSDALFAMAALWPDMLTWSDAMMNAHEAELTTVESSTTPVPA